jgi:cellulose synthase operon protein C
MTPPPFFLRVTSLATCTVLAALLWSACAPTWAVQDAKAARYYEDALTRFEKRDVEGAIIQLKNALQIDRNMLPVQMLLGKALLQSGEVVGAEVAFTEALRLGVNRAEVVVPLAQSLIAQGKHKVLLEQAQFVPGGLPSQVQMQLLLLRASASSDLGDQRGAMKSLEEARIAAPRVPEPWLAEVPLRVRARQFREAGEAVDKALALAPGMPEALYQRGSLLHVQGDLKGATALYDRVIQLDATHFESRIARAGIYVDQGKLKEATRDVEELRRQVPQEPRAAYLSALIAGRDNNQAAARAALREVTDLIDPVPVDFIRYRPQLLLLNGMSHFELGQREKAKPYLELLQRAHGNSAASKLLAQIYLSESNIARAVEVLESYVKAQPSDSQAMALLASAHMAQGRHARATSLMQEAIKLKDAPELRTALGISLVGGGQTGSGVTELENAFKRDPNQTRAGAALVVLYLRDNQPVKAISVAQVLTKQQPANPAFANLLGMAYARAAKPVEAKAAYEQALKLDDTLTDAKINLARLDIATRTYDSAQTRLAALLQANEKNVDALQEMATLELRRNKPDEAQRWLEKAVDHAGPKELRPGLSLIDLHLRAGRAVPALELARKMSSSAPDNLTVLLALARAQLANNDAAGAKNSLTNATRFAEFNPSVQVEIARLQLLAGNPPGASYSLDKALSSRSDYLPALAMLTEVEMRTGDLAKAERRAKEIADKNPKRAIGFGLQGDVARARGQQAAAMEFYRKAHQVEPSTTTLLRMFHSLARQDGGKPALQLAEQWLKTRPNDLSVRSALADGYAATGNFTAARTAYEALHKAAPDDANVLNNLANVLLRLKDPNAVKVAEQAMAKDPGNAHAIDTLGWALFQSGQTDRALQLLRDARLRQPDNPEIRFHLATVLAQTGRKTEALEEVEAALKTGRKFASANEAGSLLRNLK